MGIPAEDLEKIFDPFFRVQHGQRSGPKGLGLGLSIVRTLVELQGGSVLAKNCPAGGAEVSFTLPLRSTIPSSPLNRPVAERRVLVADDDPDIRQWLFDRLKAGGYHPEVATNGQAAFVAVQSTGYAGVILDIGLGQSDGLNVLKEIRSQNPDIPIIIMTASGSQELAVQAIGMGAQAYLLKPFDADELHAVMERWFQYS